jgi:hypothetical protein
MNASAEYWATTGGRPHSVANRDFGQDGTLWLRRDVAGPSARSGHALVAR